MDGGLIMGNVRLYGSTSGYTELAPPAIAPDGVLTLPSGTGTLATQAFVNTAVAAGGKVLQVVRATDATNRSTTSTSFVDASISVVITPQKSDSNILIIYTMGADCIGSNGANALNTTAITDSSNNLLSSSDVGWANFTTGGTGYVRVQQTVFAYNAPGTLSAVTYKGRFKSAVGFTFTSQNSLSPAQMYAIEVAA